MLDWLKRKPAAAPGEQPLENEGQRPLTDERLERMLGRLGSDGRVSRESVAEASDTIEPPPSAGNEAPSEPDRSRETDSVTAAEPAAASEVASPGSAPDRADHGLILRRGGRMTSDREPGPSAAELLAKGYSFATGPDGKMVIFDAEGNLTDVAFPLPSADSRTAGEPAAEGPSAVAPPPRTRRRTADEPAAEAPIEITPLPSADSAAAGEPAADALKDSAAAPNTSEPAAALDDAAPPARTRKRTAREPAAEASQEITPPPTRRKGAGATVGGFSQMRVIAVASQKGGSGKTTIAAHLAVRADAVGHGPVVLIDTDPQGSLAEWWHARAEDTPQLASVKPEALAINLAELRSYGTALAVIDTPPALTGSIEQVIAMSDLVLIPVRPSPHDLRAAGGTVELARRAGKPFMFIVNSASPRASITAQAVAALSEHGRVAPVILYQRTEYAASMIDGRTVTETAAAGRSAQEIAELWECVYAQIGMRVAA